MKRNDAALMLNIGCGKQRIGDVRLDVVPTSAVNIVGDAQHLPFRRGVFSEVYERNVLEHVPNPGQHLSEVRRILEEGGSVTLITDNAACLHQYLLRTHTGGYSQHYGKDKHYALFTREHIKNLMHRYGLQIRKLELIETEYPTWVFDRLVRIFLPELSHPKILVEAKKN